MGRGKVDAAFFRCRTVDAMKECLLSSCCFKATEIASENVELDIHTYFWACILDFALASHHNISPLVTLPLAIPTFIDLQLVPLVAAPFVPSLAFLRLVLFSLNSSFLLRVHWQMLRCCRPSLVRSGIEGLNPRLFVVEYSGRHTKERHS